MYCFESNKFQIQIASDVDYNDLIAEIYTESRFIALIHQENGKNDLRISFSKEI